MKFSEQRGAKLLKRGDQIIIVGDPDNNNKGMFKGYNGEVYSINYKQNDCFVRINTTNKLVKLKLNRIIPQPYESEEIVNKLAELEI